MDREDNLVAAFSYFDKDGSGYITIDELQQACKDFGLGDVHLDETIKEIDLDNVSLYVYIWSTSKSFTCLYNPNWYI
jgi:Ca2+-binding EF-hand superfamily protein